MIADEHSNPRRQRHGRPGFASSPGIISLLLQGKDLGGLVDGYEELDWSLMGGIVCACCAKWTVVWVV